MDVGVTDWSVLSLEPVPGEPDAVLAVAEDLRAWNSAITAFAGDTHAHAAAAASTGGSQTVSAYAAAIVGITPDVNALAAATENAAGALEGFADTMRTMQGQAAALHQAATSTDAEREELTHLLAELDGARSAATTIAHAAESAWVTADQLASAAAAGGAPDAGVLAQAAQAKRLALNDARAGVERIDAQIAQAQTDLASAEERLDQARADAELLAQDFEGAGDQVARGLGDVPPMSSGRFGDPGAGEGGRPSGVDIASTAIGAGPDGAADAGAGSAVGIVLGAGVGAPTAGTGAAPPLGTISNPSATGTATAGSPGVPAQPAAPAAASGGGPRGVGGSSGPGGRPGGVAVPTNPPPAPAVRSHSILEQVREADGDPEAVGELTPTHGDFEEFIGRGLQPVAARGAAMARALGFEGVIGGLGYRPTPSDHTVGLAIDLMTYDDIATGHALAEFFQAQRLELSVTYVIFNAQICSHVGDWVWRRYRHPAGRTDATAMHLDHVHVSFDPLGNSAACAAFGAEC